MGGDERIFLVEFFEDALVVVGSRDPVLDQRSFAFGAFDQLLFSLAASQPFVGAEHFGGAFAVGGAGNQRKTYE